MQAIPDIQRRINNNARRLKLRIEHHQVYLTVPPNTSEKKIQAFLKDSETWLISTWNSNYAETAANLAPVHGEILNFPLLQKSYQVQLIKVSATYLPGLATHNQRLFVQNNLLCVDAHQAGRLIKTWVRQQASIFLPEQLDQLAIQHHFTYQGCQVRHAKTRWGSCSSQKSISLNAALLLLPVELANYVLLHELCHTRQLNHSARFWQEMLKVDSSYLQHRQQLKQFKLPAWWHVN
ncbi:M48 family metallopeptidase [Alkanindiges illinoisensis]|uniref:M48 family metallopeptidase n=1 Tax=Alkanindiges illinoisensis TaxID=197183 RepID=UPI00047E69DD|nr:SprT family zinc-dependent metalloprotease [Alkanindiges illinoisensis]